MFSEATVAVTVIASIKDFKISQASAYGLYRAPYTVILPLRTITNKGILVSLNMVMIGDWFSR
jgi:hypothetical protein